ncbi:MAG: LamG domain-containing protein [Phycisphaerales bacterium]|jgi:hypothetical protein
MGQIRSSVLVVICFCLIFGGTVFSQEISFEYPYYLLDLYNPYGDCWTGMDADGRWPVTVDPEELLVGPPPSELSGVTIPIDHWIELKFRGNLVDGTGNDIFIVERDPVGEQALIFLTDGFGQEFLLGLAVVPDNGGRGLTEIGFDLAGIFPPFIPSTIRVVGIDLRGGSPGFDLAHVRARIHLDCGYTACDPNPADSATNVPIDTTLTFTPGSSAEQHIVYFGTNIADVDENAVPVSNPTQPQDTNSFHPTGLEFSKTYYWRIDEVNDTDANSPWTGNIWKFKTTDSFVLDNFESYDRHNIYQTWIPVGEAYVYLSRQPEPVHNCNQSIACNYYFDNLFYSEATTTFNTVQDWTTAGTLELFFYGNANNDIDTLMYIAIGDSDANAIIPYTGDVNNINSETWLPWRVNLQNLDINLGNIEYITIGFANNPSSPMNRGTGIVFFDDITLYSSTCYKENRLNADFNKDCMVDFIDLQEIAYNWLDSGYNIYPATAPNAPIAWYKFDGNANDSAGGAHGLLHGNPTFTNGVYGQAISFDGYEDSVEVTNALDLFSNITTGITIAFWQYGFDSLHHIDTICCSNYVYSFLNPALAINLGCWKTPGKYNWDCGWPWWFFESRLSGEHEDKSEWSGRWNHWAFTKDVESGTMQVFLNGVFHDSRTDANLPISGVTSFEIGNGWYGGYDGLIDDFRIYDYALSEAQVVYAATNGTGIFNIPLISPIDLNNDNQIDFKDFAILADSWLEQASDAPFF